MNRSVKQTVLLAALLLGLVMASAGISSVPTDTAVGRKAPVVELGKVESAIKADELKGKYVLISFWSSSDAASREATNRYNAWMNSRRPADLRYVGINFDDSPAMFREIVRRDSLNPADQYRVSQAEADAIHSTYHLANGYGSLLVTPQGRIACHNPSINQLNMLYTGR